MSNVTLTKTRLFEGVWEGMLSANRPTLPKPRIEVTHLEKPLSGIEVSETAEKGQWALRVPVPVALLSDGMQVFLIRDAESGDTLGSFSLLAGEALADDIRAEVQLLREELDMMKRAFRRHCLETL